jgi:HTH-type transcriptional regulator/antitoxin MqsA
MVGNKMINNLCDECGSSDFEVRKEPDTAQRNGQSYTVEMEYSICRQCGDVVLFPEQIKRNDCLVRDAWRKIDGLLTAQEIVDLRNKLGLTQQDAAKVFGGGINAFSKYERSEVIQSVAMDKLMRLALEMPAVLSQLKQQAGFNDKDYEDSVAIARRIIADLQIKSVFSCANDENYCGEITKNG